MSNTRIVLPLLAAALALGCDGRVPEPETVTKRNPACSIALSLHDGTGPLDLEIQRLQREASKQGHPGMHLERLGWSFVAKARRSFDPGYYRLARAAAECMDSHRAGSVEARLLKGHVLHQLHRFAEAEDIARALVNERGSHFDYGLLGDVLMERGRLDEAADAYQQMMDQRPGPQAYSRAAHLRWLTGDDDGAIELMQMAVRAQGGRDTESAAWSYVRLATYELQAKNFDNAGSHIAAALAVQTEYAPALLVKGKLDLARGNAVEAVSALVLAVERNPLPEYQWLLAEALRASGRGDEAERVENELVRFGAAEDPRTTALFLSSVGRDVETAWRLAREELEVRRDVFTLDAAAWALFALGRAEEAKAYIKEALSPGTRDARLFSTMRPLSKQPRATPLRLADISLEPVTSTTRFYLPSAPRWARSPSTDSVLTSTPTTPNIRRIKMQNPMKLCVGMALAFILTGGVASASSHMDAPLITLDDAANTTDVYAFTSFSDGVEYLTTALAVYPFEEPGIGPNKYNFDDNVLYEIHLLLGDNLSSGRKTISYQFEFTTEFQRTNTILQSYLGPVANVGGPNQNLIQRYSVWKVDNRQRRRRLRLGNGIVPPNNQGLVTPLYNQDDDGDMPARGGVDDTLDLDRYTQQSIATLADGYQAFAGQRDDGFYADIQSIFD